MLFNFILKYISFLVTFFPQAVKVLYSVKDNKI